MYYLCYTLNCWELSLFYRVSLACTGVWWRWRSCRLVGWVCLGVRVSVACLDVLCAVMFRLGASCFITLVFARCASRSLWVRAWAVGRSKPLVGMFIVNNIILYNLQVVYRQAIDTIFRMPIYPMLNRWNANPMTPNPGLWLVESNEDSYEYWREHLVCLSTQC